MPFVPAKCTQCNANLQVDPILAAAICDSCGTPFIVEKAITNYTTMNFYNAPSNDYVIRGGVLEKYNGQSVDVIVPNHVVDIAADAFTGCRLRSIVIPGSVKNLTAKMPETLEKVVFSEGLEHIGDNAFYGCTCLNDFTFPQSLRTIGAYAFYNCASLKSVHIPASTAFSGWCAFWYCGSLTDVKACRLQQFLATPWGTPIENELTAYLRNVLEQRKTENACPFCGNKIRKLYRSDGDRHYGCGICDYMYHKNSSWSGDYLANIERMKSQPITNGIGNAAFGIAGGNSRQEPPRACKAFAQLINDYLAKRGLQW